MASSKMLKAKNTDYVAAALAADCEDLLCRFQQLESVRYQDFSPIWREMGFSDLFHGSLAGNEMRKFCCLALTTAFKYFLPPYSFQIRVGGLYLLYGLYHTQLASPKEKIRIALKEWPHVQEFYRKSFASQHYDVVYILRKLIVEKAVFYTAMPVMLTYRVRKNPQRQVVCEDFRDRPDRVTDLITAEMLEEVTNIQSHYERMKEAGLENKSSVAVIRQDLTARLQGCVLDFLHWQDKHRRSLSTSGGQYEGSGDKDSDASEEQSQQVESAKRAQLLASIKTKSYGSLSEASKSRRHRQLEMDTFGSGTDHNENTMYKKKPPSLRARTWKKLGGEVQRRESQARREPS